MLARATQRNLKLQLTASQPFTKTCLYRAGCEPFFLRPRAHNIITHRSESHYYPSNLAISISIRKLTADAKEEKHPIEDQSIPPFPVRVLLVGSSVGLLTPFFATAGVVHSWYRMRPIGPPATYAYYAISMAFFGGIGSLAMNVVLPFLLHNGNLVFPFALSNAVVAGAIYGSMEKSLGLQAVVNGDVGNMLMPALKAARLEEEGLIMKTLRTLKVTGPVIGILTATIAPFLWPLAIKICWGSELKIALLGNETAWWLTEFTSTFLWPVVIPIGGIAGFAMHHLLGPLLVGSLPGTWAGTPWTQTAGPVLVAVLAATGLYIALSRVSVEDLHWVVRKNPSSGLECSFNTRTRGWADGTEKADRASNSRILLSQAEWLRMQPAQTFLRDLWYDIRWQAWGVKKPVKQKIETNAVGKALEQEQVVHLIDDLLRLRVLLDEEASRETSPAKRIENREERMKLIEVAKEKGVDLEETLFCAEVGVVALTAGTQKETDKAWMALQRASNGLVVEISEFGKDYSDLIGHHVSGSCLAAWRSRCLEQTSSAQKELLVQCGHGSAKSIKQALDNAYEQDVDDETIAKGKKALRIAIRSELRAATRAWRCHEIRTLANEAKEHGLDEKEIAQALSKAVEVETKCKQAATESVSTNNIKRMDRAIEKAKMYQVDGPWLEVVEKKAEALKAQRKQAWDEFLGTIYQIIFVMGFCPLACVATWKCLWHSL